MPKCIVIIPVRFDSERLPGKALLEIGGISMIERVYRQVQKARDIDRIIIATDDDRIRDHVMNFGGEVEMTFRSHVSGTDRCAQVAQEFWTDDIIINVQGDEPFISPELIDELANKMREDEWLQIATCKTQILEELEIQDVNTVKVVCDKQGRALYFSRLPLPYIRDKSELPVVYFKHIGIYAFRNKVLQEVTSLEKSPLESAEKLEQLRWMEYGNPIYVFKTDYQSRGIDTMADLENARKLLI